MDCYYELQRQRKKKTRNGIDTNKYIHVRHFHEYSYCILNTTKVVLLKNFNAFNISTDDTNRVVLTTLGEDTSYINASFIDVI